RAELATAKMLHQKYYDVANKVMDLEKKVNSTAEAASNGLTDNLMNKISDAELEKLRIAAKKAESDYEYSKDIRAKLWDLTTQHNEGAINASTKDARELLLKEMFQAWLAEFHEDKKLLERLAV